jgi:hypothetical protein
MACFGPAPAEAASQTPKVPSAPGDVLGGSSSLKILLEGGRVLLWPEQGPLVLQDAAGRVLATLDPKLRVKKQKGEEALELEVEEADLGGSSSDKRYLKGKKDPRGRSLDPASLETGASASEQVEENRSTVQGIAMTTRKFPNGSHGMKAVWPDATEEVFFDRRHTLVSVKQTRPVGPLQYTLEQWADGSFTRRYRGKSAELSYTFDAIDRSYRISVSNADGEPVAEVSCNTVCRVEE